MKISLIITTFNAEKYLHKAVDSFLAQNYQDKELIILDKKSNDRTHKIIAQYQQNFPHLIKWIKELDFGISHGRNIALKHATGDLIGFLGADDFLHNDFYQQMICYAKLNPDFDVMYFNSYTIGNKSSFDNSAAILFTKRNLIKFCPIASGECFYYRRQVFDFIKFNEKNRYSMDYELNMALVASGKYRFFPVNITAVFNGSYSDSISSFQSLKQRLETISVQLKYANNLKEKICILLRRKKLILKNFKTFCEIKKIIC